MALDILAAEYAAEDSQTMTTVLDKEDGSDSDTDANEDTVIEYTVDSHIDAVYKLNSASDTLVSPPQQKYAQPSGGHNIIYPPNHPSISPNVSRTVSTIKHQPSTDFLLMVESLQNQLHQKDTSLKLITKQLSQKRIDYDNISRTNNELKQQMYKLREKDVHIDESNKSQLIQMSQQLITKNEYIDALNKQILDKDNTINALQQEIEQYQEVEQWLAMQIKWETAGSIATKQSIHPKLTVKTLEEWKHSSRSIDAYDYEQKEYNVDETKQGVAEDETALLLDKTVEEKKKEKEKKEKYEKELKSHVEKQITNANNKTCYHCVPWFT